MTRIAIAALTVLAAALAAACGAAASSPAPTRTAPNARPYESPLPFTDFGFRVHLSGPATAHAGDQIAYTLDYQRIGPTPRGWDDSIVLDYGLVRLAEPMPPVATLVGIEPVVGPAPTGITPQVEGLSENLTFAADGGSLRILVQPVSTFIGPLTIHLYIRGSSIEFPRGSVIDATTNITAS